VLGESGVVRKLLLAAVATIALCPPAAHAANHGFYVSLDAGAVSEDLGGPYSARPLHGLLGLFQQVDPSPDLGWAVFGAAGLRFDGPFRIEGEIGYRANTLSSLSDIDQLSVMANVLYDWQLGDRFALSFGGGLGMDRISWTGEEFTFARVDDDDWCFAVQGIVAASYRLSAHTAIDLKYRYMRPMDVDLHALVDGESPRDYTFTATDAQTHTISLGLTFDLD